MEVPLAYCDEWQRALDNMPNLDLDADRDPALAAWLLCKRPDVLSLAPSLSGILAHFR